MKKEQYLHVRMDEETIQLLKEGAEKHNQKGNVSAYIRYLIRLDNRAMTDDLAAALHGLEHQMIRIGNNINQIARSANAGLMSVAQKDELMIHMKDLMDQMDGIATQVLAMRGSI